MDKGSGTFVINMHLRIVPCQVDRLSVAHIHFNIVSCHVLVILDPCGRNLTAVCMREEGES